MARPKQNLASRSNEISVLTAPCYVGNLTIRELKQMLAYNADVVCPTEVYNKTFWLKRRVRYAYVGGKSKTDRRRGPRDNPILVRRTDRFSRARSGALQGCKASTPINIAPERWITYVVYNNVLVINIHPNAAVQIFRFQHTHRAKMYREMMKKVVNLFEDFHGVYNLEVIVVGDLNFTNAASAPDWAPGPMFKNLEMKYDTRQLTWVAWTRGLEPSWSQDIIHNGQDHPWILKKFRIVNG